MTRDKWIALAVAGAAVLILAAIFGLRALTGYRVRRRRRRSHSPLVSTARRPMVRFSVNVPEPPSSDTGTSDSSRPKR
jgi:hypothetical protein